MSAYDAFRPALILSVLAIFFGFGLGGVFGAAEDALKDDLKHRAEAVRESVYGGDEEKLSKTVQKSWTYYKRAHLHAGSLGTSSLALTLLLMFWPNAQERWRSLTALALGIGALGYGIFWLWAGYLAPELGSTSAAKAQLEWLAIPSAGLLIGGVVSVLLVLIKK
ncbi:MAG: hypothetical protein ACFCUI_08120 [Bernardetiaceae bacterium]